MKNSFIALVIGILLSTSLAFSDELKVQGWTFRLENSKLSVFVEAEMSSKYAELMEKAPSEKASVGDWYSIEGDFASFDAADQAIRRAVNDLEEVQVVYSREKSYNHYYKTAVELEDPATAAALEYVLKGPRRF